MQSKKLIDKSIHIITEYYNNNLQPYFDHMSEDSLWIGPAEKQELRGREVIISTFLSEEHKLTFTMGPIRSSYVSLNDNSCEIMLQYEIYTHYPNGDTDFHNQRLHYSWYKNTVEARWEIAMVHISNAWHYDSNDTIYPVHYHTVAQHIYDGCDYFVYLDAKNNSYHMIRGEAGMILLPEESSDYEGELIKYADAFVQEEDRERVLYEMGLERIMEQIELNGVHSFDYGIVDSKRGYARKRLDYRYHDQKNKIILMSRTDITDSYFEEEKKRQELEQAILYAQTDSLTKLWNLRAISSKIKEYLEDENQLYALYFIDLDDFKGINDNFGHPIGDYVLISISRALQTIQGKDDLIGRVGGDEFVYFAPISDKKQAEAIAQKICYAIHSVKISHDTERRVTGSVGIALAPEDGRDYNSLVRKADRNLYEAKKGGKNRYIF